MERALPAFGREDAKSEFNFDFRRIGTAIVQGVSLLWAPSENAVEQAGTTFMSWVGGLAFPLAQAPSVEQFDIRLTGLATPQVLKQLFDLTDGKAFEIWSKQLESKAKVKALYGDKEGPPDSYIVSWRDDVHARMEKFSPLFLHARNMKGARHPPKTELESAAARYLVSLVALEVSAAPAMKVARELGYQAWFHCCEALRQLGAMYGVAEVKFLPEKAVRTLPVPPAHDSDPDVIYAAKQDHADLARVLRLGPKLDALDEVI